MYVYDSKVYAEEQEKDHSKSKRRDRSNLAIRRDSTPLELPTEKLLRWRRAVKDAMSASQLALCMCELERCIAWEKSGTIVVSLSLSPPSSIFTTYFLVPSFSFFFCLSSSVTGTPSLAVLSVLSQWWERESPPSLWWMWQGNTHILLQGTCTMYMYNILTCTCTTYLHAVLTCTCTSRA